MIRHQVSDFIRYDLPVGIVMFILVFLMVFGIAHLASGAEPQFVVTNKTTPTFTVENKTKPPTPAPDAKKSPCEFCAKLPNGCNCGNCGCDSFHGKKAGAATPSGTTFQSGQRHMGHNCPSCGYQSPAGQGTWIVRGSNRDGTHAHQCPKCSTTWSH